jgi:hypothetical protein
MIEKDPLDHIYLESVCRSSLGSAFIDVKEETLGFLLNVDMTVCADLVFDIFSSDEESFISRSKAAQVLVRYCSFSTSISKDRIFTKCLKALCESFSADPRWIINLLLLSSHSFINPSPQQREDMLKVYLGYLHEDKEVRIREAAAKSIFICHRTLIADDELTRVVLLRMLVDDDIDIRRTGASIAGSTCEHDVIPEKARRGLIDRIEARDLKDWLAENDFVDREVRVVMSGNGLFECEGSNQYRERGEIFRLN